VGWRDGADRSLCFAYSPQERQYACTLLSVEPASDGEWDVSTPEIDTTVAHAQRLGARIVQGVVLTTNSAWCAEPDGRLNRYHLEFDEDLTWCGAETVVSEEELADRLRGRGYVLPVELWADLPADAWIPFGGAELRYSVTLTDSGVSFEYWGKLEIRCGAGEEPQDVFAFLEGNPNGLHIGGPLARVSTAVETTLRALSVEVHDGGEGYVSVDWQHWVFDERDYCPR
jgi:hypothetical protein